jgi:Xaa-Pro dipeptidase
LEDYVRFDFQEFHSRHRRLKELMQQREMAATLITDPFDFYYFTGSTPLPMDFRGLYYVALLPLDGEPTIMVPLVTEEGARKETWIKNLHVYRSTQDPVDILKSCFNDLDLTAGNVGLELGRKLGLGISHQDFVRLSKELPAVNFADASDMISDIRMVKSQRELECLRTAAGIASRALDAVAEHAKVGMSEKQVMQILDKTIVENGGLNAWSFVSSGPHNYAIINRGPTDRKLSEGNVLWIDCGCTSNGYFSDIARSFAIGRRESKQEKMHNIVVNVTSTLVNKLLPGAKISDIDKECANYLARFGLNPSFNIMCGELGHGVGLNVDEAPTIWAHDTTTILPGMYLAIEPGFITNYGCFQTEQNVAVTERGPEIYSVATTDLRVIRS